ncbi:ketopantoate reductase [Aquimarina sp. MAR_2010_214]|uniref:ketopantoate reductase C-terminal domain-containing protein n=1 Tax=Aquimarina sp. MAR_2010_214 TaxID=1250026 RepID=UPI000C7081E5|nr:ketopantoate reductase C-terminal domain-containing protein [Aquimarina sp. MAR_2010_214]PKV50450.1 ketopantoate reductase [Aquimarina sp. MAR_2010_214]
MRKIGILGLGAIGSVMSRALVAHPENEIFYYTRTPKSKIKIQFQNKKIEIPIDSKKERSEELDWLLICLKEYHFETAKEQLVQLIGVYTKVVVIRNGIELKAPITPFTTDENILECMIDCPTQPIEDNYYLQYRKPILKVEKSKLAKRFRALFTKNDVQIIEVQDYKTENWKKLIESSALGSILCLTGRTCSVFENPEVIDLYKDLLREGIEVAKSNGAIIEGNFESEMLDKIATYSKTKGSSMLSDRLTGNIIEVNAKNGAIEKVASQNKIATPINDTICKLLRQINQN